jgi:hypothetical protein
MKTENLRYRNELPTHEFERRSQTGDRRISSRGSRPEWVADEHPSHPLTLVPNLSTRAAMNGLLGSSQDAALRLLLNQVEIMETLSELMRDRQQHRETLARACADTREVLDGLSMTGTKPQRTQLHRTKGWPMPPNTVNVDSNTKWGNPFVVGQSGGIYADKVKDHRHAWQLFNTAARNDQAVVKLAKAELRGKNLACWCPLPQSHEHDECHAAVLLEIANE